MLNRLFTFIVMLFVLMGCGPLREIPIETIEKIVYRDSLVYIHDSIEVQVPVEKVVEVLPELDTSCLKTSVAESIAYLDTAKRQIHHTLEQKGEIMTVYDTIVSIQYVDRLVEKEVPVEVEVIKYKRDAMYWALVGWAIFCLLFFVTKTWILQ